MNKELKPIEKLYLISKERPTEWNNKNKLLTLINTLQKEKSLILTKGGIKFKSNNEKCSKSYELDFIQYLRSKDWIGLNKWIHNLNFEQTLFDNQILKEDIKIKKFLFWKLAKTHIFKTPEYYRLHSIFSEKFEKKHNIGEIIFEEENFFNDNKVEIFYNTIVNKIKEAAKKQAEKKSEEDKKQMEELNFN